MAYVGFKGMLAKGMSPGLAASIGRKKYGAVQYQKHAAAGKSLQGVPPKKKKRPGVPLSPGERPGQ